MARGVVEVYIIDRVRLRSKETGKTVKSWIPNPVQINDLQVYRDSVREPGTFVELDYQTIEYDF